MNGTPFSSVFKAQSYFSQHLQSQESVRPLVVLLRYLKVPASVDQLTHLEIPTLSVNLCTNVWTYLLVYCESKREEDSNPTEPTSDGEMPGRVFPFGFINSAWLQQRVGRHYCGGVTVKRSETLARPFVQCSHASYDFYRNFPLFGNHEFTMPEIETAIKERLDLMLHVASLSFVGQPVECKSLNLELLHLTSRRQVELDYAVFNLLIWVNSRSPHVLRMEPEDVAKMYQQWIDWEICLLHYRLLTCAASRLADFLVSDLYECYTRDKLLSAVEANAYTKYYIDKVESLTDQFVVARFEDVSSIGAFTRKRVLMQRGFAIFPLVYALPCVLEWARQSILFALERLSTLRDSNPQKFDLAQTCLRNLKRVVGQSDSIKSVQKKQQGVVSVSQAMQFAPKCVRSLLHRALHGTREQRLQYNERAKLSQCAAALGIDWEELSLLAKRNLSKVYDKDQERKAAIKTLRYAYDRKIDKTPNCKRMLEFGLCGHVETARRQNMNPEDVCCNELRQRTGKSIRTLYSPQFFFSLARQCLESVK